MQSLNEVNLIGFLGKDPEMRTTQAGKECCTFSMATTTSWKDDAGEWHDKTEWHNIVAWEVAAKALSKHLKKGHRLYISGKLSKHSWTDDEGVKRYTTDIIVRDFIFLEKFEKSSDQQDNAPPPPVPSEPLKADQDDEEDVPF